MSTAGKRIEQVLSFVLTTAAVVIAAAVVHREIAANRGDPTGGGSAAAQAEYHPDWRDWLKHGRYSGDTLARFHLIQFVDLECPACRQFHLIILPVLREQFGTELSISVVHLPLSIHRFARQAAHASECAGQQGRFEQFITSAFEKQDSIGLKSWSSFGREAGVRDSAGFAKCVALSPLPALVESGVGLARRLDIRATPTVFVNGWLIPSPSLAELQRTIRELTAGRDPYPRVLATTK